MQIYYEQQIFGEKEQSPTTAVIGEIARHSRGRSVGLCDESSSCGLWAATQPDVALSSTFLLFVDDGSLTNLDQLYHSKHTPILFWNSATALQ